MGALKKLLADVRPRGKGRDVVEPGGGGSTDFARAFDPRRKQDEYVEHGSSLLERSTGLFGTLHAAHKPAGRSAVSTSRDNAEGSPPNVLRRQSGRASSGPNGGDRSGRRERKDCSINLPRSSEDTQLFFEAPTTSDASAVNAPSFPRASAGSPPVWRAGSTPRPLRGGEDWSTQALNENLTGIRGEGLSVAAAAARSTWQDRPRGESSSDPQNKALRHPRRCNSTKYWERLGARGVGLQDAAAEDRQAVVHGYGGQPYDRLRGEMPLELANSDIAEEEWRSNSPSAGTYSTSRGRKDLHHDRLALWSAYSPDAKSQALGDPEEIERQRQLYEELQRKHSRDAEYWCVDEEPFQHIESARPHRALIRAHIREQQRAQGASDRLRALQLQEDQAREREGGRRQAHHARWRDCAACAETKRPIEFPLQAATAQCDHPPNLCYDCLKSWMASELDTKGCHDFKCPECPQILTFIEVQLAASEETFAAFDRLATRNALGGLEEFAWCLHPRCGNGQLNVESNPFMICSACGYQQCLKHRIEWHYGESCDQYDYRISGRQAEDEEQARRVYEGRLRRGFSSLKREESRYGQQQEQKRVRVEAKRRADEEKKTAAMIGSVSKECPGRCGARIEHRGGCDHMTCRKCRHEFCFPCLAPHREIERLGNSAHKPFCKNHSDNVR